MGKTIERIKEFIEFKGISLNQFDKEIGAGNGYIGKQIVKNASIGSDKIEKMLSKYIELNPRWLLTGKGEMLILEEFNKSLIMNESYSNKIPVGSIPYYEVIVMAGNKLSELTGTITPDGYIKDIPGIENTEALFPVRGCSMSPEIKEGAIIGVKRVSNIESLNTQHKYFIVTMEDRMIKYIAYDRSDTSILWCKSPNFGDFPIKKSSILEIHRVTLVINPE